MSVFVEFVLSLALVGSLCLLAHTIYRRPTITTATAATTLPSSHKRFPIVGSETSAARDLHAPEGVGEVDDAYRAWLQSLDDLHADVMPSSTNTSAR